MKKNRIVGIFVFLLTLSSIAFAVSSVNVPLDSPVYHELDLLEGMGLMKNIVHGQKPYSRDTVARLIVQASDNLKDSNKSKAWAQKVLDDLKEQFANDIKSIDKKKGLDLHPIESVHATLTFLDSDARVIPANNGTGTINAITNPLVQNRGGRHYTDGAQYAFETVHRADVESFASVYFQPRFEFQFPTGGAPDRNKAYVQELYGVAQYKNLRLTFGRSALALGQGEHGGLNLSDNARPLDQIVFGSDHPFYFPWIFKYLGLNQIKAYFATLGPEQFFKNTILAGYKWTLKPASILELGLSNTMTIGGTGAPSFGFSNFLGDFVGFAATTHSASNRILGLDGRVRLPFLRNSQIYGEVFFDDKTTQSLKRTFVDTVAYYGGIEVPRIDAAGKFFGRAEFSYLSEIFYRHFQFKSGLTLNQFLLGSPTGPDSRSIHLELGFTPTVKTTIMNHFYYDWADSNTYSLTGTSSTVLVNNPQEKRIRDIIEVRHDINSFISLKCMAGYEKVSRFNFVSGDNRNNFLGEVGLNFHFGDRLRRK